MEISFEVCFFVSEMLQNQNLLETCGVASEMRFKKIHFGNTMKTCIFILETRNFDLKMQTNNYFSFDLMLVITCLILLLYIFMTNC